MSDQRHHHLKIEEAYFEDSIIGRKRFEVRYNDRGYQKGDTITLHEIRDVYKNYTNRKIHGVITYVTNYAQKDGWVVFGWEEQIDE